MKKDLIDEQLENTCFYCQEIIKEANNIEFEDKEKFIKSFNIINETCKDIKKLFDDENIKKEQALASFMINLIIIDKVYNYFKNKNISKLLETLNVSDKLKNYVKEIEEGLSSIVNFSLDKNK